MNWVRRAFEAPSDASQDAVLDGPAADTSPALHAVIAAILRQGVQGAELLLIRRADNPRDPWSGHMALPGGRRDPGDSDLVATAIREVSEEIGLDLRRDAQLLGRLDVVRPHALGRELALSVLPLVFALHGESALAPNPREVQAVIWARIEHLLSPRATSSFEYSEQMRRYRLPAFDVDGHVVWGLTQRVLANLLTILRASAAATYLAQDGSKDPR